MSKLPKAAGTVPISEWRNEAEKLNALTFGEKTEEIDCPKCNNRGIVYFMQGDEVVSKKCECWKVRQSLARIRRSGLQSLIKTYTFDRYLTEQPFQKFIKQKALDFVQSKPKCFFIGGQVGCGKSHICTAIVGELLRQGLEARYMQWRDDVTSIKANANTADYSRLLTPFKTVPVLYIDDLFKTEAGKLPTTADVNIAFEIINHRYINPNYVTVISTEKNMDELIASDEAVASRICEMAGKYMTSIGRDRAKNYRLKGVIS